MKQLDNSVMWKKVGISRKVRKTESRGARKNVNRESRIARGGESWESGEVGKSGGPKVVSKK